MCCPKVWVSKDHPDTEATVVLASKSDPQLDLISKMQVNIEAEVEKNLKTYGKTWRPNKKKPELGCKDSVRKGSSSMSALMVLQVLLNSFMYSA